MRRTLTILAVAIGLAWPWLAGSITAESTEQIAVQSTGQSTGRSQDHDLAQIPTPPGGTPVTEPVPELVPLHLPYVTVNFDALLPPPLESRFRGWVGVLTPSGREACYPATHVLLDRPEGTLGVQAIAVMLPMRPDDPDLTLDLFAGEYVEVIGTSGPAPEPCIVTWQKLTVGAIVALDPPAP